MFSQWFRVRPSCSQTIHSCITVSLFSILHAIVCQPICWLYLRGTVPISRWLRSLGLFFIPAILPVYIRVLVGFGYDETGTGTVPTGRYGTFRSSGIVKSYRRYLYRYVTVPSSLFFTVTVRTFFHIRMIRYRYGTEKLCRILFLIPYRTVP